MFCEEDILFICFSSHAGIEKQDPLKQIIFSQDKLGNEGVCFTACLCIRSYFGKKLERNKKEITPENLFSEIEINLSDIVAIFTKYEAVLRKAHQTQTIYSCLIKRDRKVAEKVPLLIAQASD